MNMMQMVAAMVICYFITLTLLSIYRKHINVKVANTIFIIVDLVFFFCWNYAAYLQGWLKTGFMTLGNVSPFIMTLIPLTVFMREKVKQYCNAAIAFLWLGMFLALMISPEHAYIFNYNIEASFIYTSEAACHLLASLYGVWLMISGQVECNLKNLKRSVICMYLVIGYGVFLNFMFHKNNFGMDPYNGAAIYMIDVLNSFEATLVAYLIGVFLVLLIGVQFGHGLKKLVDEAHGEGKIRNSEFEIRNEEFEAGNSEPKIEATAQETEIEEEREMEEVLNG